MDLLPKGSVFAAERFPECAELVLEMYVLQQELAAGAEVVTLFKDSLSLEDAEAGMGT